MTAKYLQELIRKYAEGTASNEEMLELSAWYRSSPIEEVHWQTSIDAEKQHLYNRMLQRLRNEVSRKKAKTFPISWAKVAALLIIVAGAAIAAFQLSNTFSKSYVTITNPPGKIQFVRLPDGSGVWLNAASTLRYVREFKKARELELVGQAYFEVKHNEENPFSVNAGGVLTADIGTSFAIKAYQNENVTSVSVISGSVKVTNYSKDLAVLTPLMQLEIDRKHQTLKTTKIDTASVLAWKNGRLLFDGQTFSDIARTLEKWYGIQIQFINPKLQACRYYMSFDNGTSLDNLLYTMAELTGMEYTIDKKTNIVTLSGKECR